jgi:cell division protein FtsB
MDKPRREDRRSAERDGRVVAAERRRPVAMFVLLFVALVLVLDGIAGERGWFANRRARLQIEQEEQELAARRRENAELYERARRMREDPATIEGLAREELGYIRPGEKVFIIRDVQKPTKQ